MRFKKNENIAAKLKGRELKLEELADHGLGRSTDLENWETFVNGRGSVFYFSKKKDLNKRDVYVLERYFEVDK